MQTTGTIEVGGDRASLEVRFRYNDRVIRMPWPSARILAELLEGARLAAAEGREYAERGAMFEIRSAPRGRVLVLIGADRVAELPPDAAVAVIRALRGTAAHLEHLERQRPPETAGALIVPRQNGNAGLKLDLQRRWERLLREE